MLTVVIAAADEPSRGWGGPVALLIVVVIYITGATIHSYFMPEEDPSPTDGGAGGVRVKPQVKAVSDTDDTARDTEPDTDWWGGIATIGGRLVRVYSRPASAVEEPADEDVDVDLDDEPEEDEEESIEDVIDRLDQRGVSYNEIVSVVMAQERVSESTAKRRIRDARALRSAEV